jgi:hypothetical protein
VTVEPTAKVPLTFVLDVRVMVQVPVAVFRVICEASNPITVPLSVLFPGEGVGTGLERGRGLGVGLTAVVAAAVVVVVVVVGAQLTRTAALARIQICLFAFIDSCCSGGSMDARHFLIYTVLLFQEPKAIAVDEEGI